ncbi:MAG: ABC transporter permease [Clostridia bacterium]|nr:ABC transporter permease [Clostridia bacterium]
MYLFKYILKRLGLVLLTFFVVILVCFVLVKLLPSKPTASFTQSQELIEARREKMGYNLPIIQQFYRFVKYGLQGDFGVGESIYVGSEVWEVFTSKLPYTVAINIYSTVLSVPLGLVFGVLAAIKKNKWQDHVISTGVMIFVSIPSFIYGFIVQYLLCFKLGWFPAIMDASQGAFSWVGFVSVIPAIICMSLGSIASYARSSRAELAEVLTSDYLLLARTKGLSRGQATVRHAMRNAMVPIFPSILGEFIAVMSGSLIIEQMFSIPGVGKLYVSAIKAPIPDYNFFMLLTCFYTLIGLVASIIIDISYGIIDPRIRLGAR